MLMGCETTIESNLTEEQANQVLLALNSASIPASKIEQAGSGKDVRYRIDVVSGDVASSLSLLKAGELPKRPEPGFNEIYKETGIIPTVSEEKARLAAAISGELSRTLESIDGVVDARVHLAMAESEPITLDSPRTKPRASILIKLQKKREPIDKKVIENIVKGAIQGIEQRDIAIVQMHTSNSMKTTSKLVRFGPIVVSSNSAPAFRLILGVTLLLNAVLAMALIVVLYRYRRNAKQKASN